MFETRMIILIVMFTDIQENKFCFLLGSHHRSVEMVVKGIVDTAAIDCNVLCLYLKEHPEYRDQIHTVCTLGPVPIQPIVINSRMGGM